VSVYAFMILMLILFCLFMFCRDGFWSTSGSSFRGSFWGVMSVLTRLRLDGNPAWAILIMYTTEASLIWWWMMMSSWGRTRIVETSHLFRTFAGTPVGLWSTKTGCAVTYQSGFSDNTTIVRPFPKLMRWLGVLT